MKAEHERAMTNLEDTLRKDLAEHYRRSDEEDRKKWLTFVRIEKEKVEMEVNSRVSRL